MVYDLSNQESTANLKTLFASPVRDNLDQIRKQVEKLANEKKSIEAFDALPDLIVILNSHRQIVYANQALLKYLNVPDNSSLIGKRPGELLGCSHASEMEAGCGCSESCQVCGAVNAILHAQEGESMTDECRITTVTGDAMDLRVWTRPFSFNGTSLVLLTIADISSEKRRRALERIFFHDVINTAGGIRGFAQFLVEEVEGEDEEELKQIVFNLSERLLDEIQAQRILMNAEQNELVIYPVMIPVYELLNTVKNLYRNHDVADGKILKINSLHGLLEIESDRTLLIRVLGNMIKNALEACRENQTVILSTELSENCLLFHVNNPTFMPRKVQLQIFSRSFSTKGTGRGLGTYSMKLLGERYLKGQVSFVSSEEAGTTFTLQVPLQFPQ